MRFPNLERFYTSVDWRMSLRDHRNITNFVKFNNFVALNPLECEFLSKYLKQLKNIMIFIDDSKNMDRVANTIANLTQLTDLEISAK